MLSFCFIFAVLLSTALLSIYFTTSYIEYSDKGEKMTAFECGFDPMSQTRSPFSTRYFLLVVLFLVFDVEVALLFPLLSVVSFSSGSVEMALSFLLFLTILLLGTFHEWNEGALDWISE